MKYKINKIDTEAEGQIVTGMIVDDKFIKHIQTIYHGNLLESPYAKTIAGWCTNYFKKYESAPGSSIQEIYNSNKDTLDETQSDLIETFLSNLSEKYEEKNFNSEYALDAAESYFKTRSLLMLKDKISTAVINKDTETAEALIGGYTRVARPSSKGIDILRDREAIREAHMEQEDQLFALPGALGKMLKPFCRGDFISFAGPAGRGKTWWLMESGVRAMLKGLKVLFISMEMTQNQMIRRFYQNILGETKDKPSEPILIPYLDESNEVCFKHTEKKGVSIAAASKKAKAIDKMIKSGQFKLICFPANSASVSDIKLHLDNMEHYDDFVPDVIISDYADITAPDYHIADHRQKIDNVWLGYRGLAQEKHCCVITATHTNKATFSRDIEQGDATEDIRKMNHVTCMIGLNQKVEDKENGIMRLKILKQRHEGFSLKSEVVVLYQFAIGKPYLNSYIKNNFGGE